MSETGTKLTAEEIKQSARETGIELTGEWLDDLVDGSAFVIWARRHLREMSEAASQAEMSTCRPT